jgi:hypothetical protein
LNNGNHAVRTRPRARSVATRMAVALAIACWLAQLSDALAFSGPRLQRASAISLTREMFKRFFFTLWLGEPLSLQGSPHCPDADIRKAMQRKDRFPETFKRKTLTPETYFLKYCSPVSVTGALPENKAFTLKAPKVNACGEYIERWHSFVSGSDLAQQIRPYIVSYDTYNKYRLSEMSVYHSGIDREPKPRFIIGQQLIFRFRMVQWHEQNDFCYFDFAYVEGRA